MWTLGALTCKMISCGSESANPGVIGPAGAVSVVAASAVVESISPAGRCPINVCRRCSALPRLRSLSLPLYDPGMVVCRSQSSASSGIGRSDWRRARCCMRWSIPAGALRATISSANDLSANALVSGSSSSSSSDWEVVDGGVGGTMGRGADVEDEAMGRPKKPRPADLVALEACLSRASGTARRGVVVARSSDG